MSYDLSFWRQRGASPDEPRTLQRRLLEGLPVDGVDELPIAAMRERTGDVFASWTKVDDDVWERDAGGAGPAFQLFTTPQLFHVTCSGLAGSDMNRFIDLALEFACPLFDPQTGERFG